MTDTTIQQRLEQLRVFAGYDSLRAWHRAVKGAGYDCVYQSIRNWHSDRLPPVDYLQVAAELTGGSLQWIIAGDGPILRQDLPDAPAAWGNAEIVRLLRSVTASLVRGSQQLTTDAAVVDSVADVLEQGTGQDTSEYPTPKAGEPTLQGRIDEER